MDIISKQEARLVGASTYFTGRPCKHGHLSERYVSNGHCKVCVDIRHKQWRKDFPEKTNAISQRWKKKNKDALAAYKKAYNAKFPEKNAACAVRYRKRNPQKIRAWSRSYKAKKASAEGHHTAADIDRIWQHQSCHCNACACELTKTGFHVDHIVAISKGGTNWPDNLQLLCPACNLSKGDKDFTEWLRSRIAA